MSVFPEARYRVFYADGRGDQSSRLMRAGEYMPAEALEEHLDYQTSAIDPSDDRTVWLMSVFGEKASNGYRAVVGKLTP